MKPNYKDININAIPKHSGLILPNGEPWETHEHIMVKPAYTEKDLEGMEHLNYAAGIAPFLRGPYSTMYVMRPWTIRQYAGFSTAELGNCLDVSHLFTYFATLIVGRIFSALKTTNDDEA